MGVELATEKAGFAEMEDVYFSDSELVYHVRDALRLVPLGDSDSYNQLIGVMHHTKGLTPDEVALLVTSLKALSGAVSYIDIVHHWSLLSSIFGMSLWNYGSDVMEALVELIISLAASSGKYVDSCLHMLVSNFMPPYSFLELLKQPRGVATKDQVLYHVHSALKDIADLVPLAPLKLQDIITQRMPNMFTKEPLIVIYVENMLRLESGALGEVIGSMMLIAVVDRLIDLDVEIGWDEILQDDSSKGIFEMELEDMEGTADDAEKDSDELPIECLSRKSFAGNIVAEKLDSLMVLTFEHLQYCNEGGRLIQVYETLLESFQKTVLTAYKSKFAQFVMFYACSLDPENCGVRFAKMLADIFMNGQSPLHRMSAVAYLASYLSRAKFLSASFVAIILERLVNWCFNYCQTRDGDINPEAHRVFYSGCQAVMYVLCFRMRSMMGVSHIKSRLLLMPIEAILKHPLNPLKVCLPSIVEEFLRQAKAACLFTGTETFVFNDLLESELSRAFGGMERLDMFFPFDPCLLKKSDRFIRSNFVYWSIVRTTYDDDEESSSDEDVAENCAAGGNRENIADDGMASSFEEHDLDLDEFDYSLNKMSITPKNSLNYRFGGDFRGPMQMPSRIRPSTSPESL
uniref:Putative RNA polymerase I-specific transcription initiation factor rrn3 n=1 Tax=Davidia involucrata TaxID=16924 RepID=A0A5B6ZC63_DAVIN